MAVIIQVERKKLENGGNYSSWKKKLENGGNYSSWKEKTRKWR